MSRIVVLTEGQLREAALSILWEQIHPARYPPRILCHRSRVGRPVEGHIHRRRTIQSDCYQQRSALMVVYKSKSLPHHDRKTLCASCM